MAAKADSARDDIPHLEHSILRLQHADNLALAGLGLIADPGAVRKCTGACFLVSQSFRSGATALRP